jgi:hypothetical protein
MSKLTLSIDKDIIEEARHMATEQQTSISEMFSNFIKGVSRKRSKDKLQLTPLTKKVSGIAKIADDVDYKQLISDSLAEKYGYGG